MKARDFLRSRIDGKEVYIQTIRDRKGKYRRYLGEIFPPSDNDELINVNDLVVAKGHAVYKDY